MKKKFNKIEKIEDAMAYIDEILQGNCNDACKEDHIELKKWLQELIINIKLLNKIHNLLIFIKNAPIKDINETNTYYLPQIDKNVVDDLCNKIGNILSKYKI